MLVCPRMVISFPVTLTSIMETGVPESATHVSFFFVDLPNTLPLISSDALFFFSLEILTLLILSMGCFFQVQSKDLLSGDVALGSVSFIV